MDLFHWMPSISVLRLSKQDKNNSHSEFTITSLDTSVMFLRGTFNVTETESCTQGIIKISAANPSLVNNAKKG